ncbi:hypothetical protein SUGI_0940590 [Cryptomeria japonica]|uniref:uncharacterized protein LOC131075905 n=1 Tax=Cryptomeria japonica TaxID=3369 RepID=UPI0024148D79|nr:uncharacterized protein LOC131075905 [Cryptomeria japonica]GLJ44732.1 hypothetical protein SUGI_0940590 [Cryptomeria japonica]
MGVCISSQSNESQPTANLILMDGRIEVFSEPLKCKEILQQYPGHFICSSDGLYIGRKICDVLEEDDQLQVGQLYFLLPIQKLEYVLTDSDMAALLLKASSALQQRRSRSKKVQHLFDVHLDLKEENQELSWAEESWRISLCLTSQISVLATSRGCKNQWHSKLETIMEGL